MTAEGVPDDSGAEAALDGMTGRARVVICGGGVAAIEALLGCARFSGCLRMWT